MTIKTEKTRTTLGDRMSSGGVSINSPKTPNKDLKKVLFISYYWPPAGGAPIQRILKFYKYLPEYGWNPIILTTENGDFPYIDNDLLGEIRPESKIYRAKNFSLHKLFSLFVKNPKEMFVPFAFTEKKNKSIKSRVSRWAKYNIIPDTRIFWKRRAIRKGKKILRSEKIDLIFSSSPPQTNHRIAKALSKKFRIPWIGDLRDPWTDVYWINTNTQRWKIVHRIDKKIERKTLNAMTAITTVSPGWVKLFESKSKSPVFLIHNGFDERNEKALEKNKKFTITYAGSISVEQDLNPFCQAILQIEEKLNLSENLHIRFIGNFPSFVKEILEKYSFYSQIEFIPYMPSEKVKAYISSSDLLLLLIHITADGGAINFKMYDYMAAGKPILAYGSLEGDATEILHTSKCGRMFTYEQINESSDFIYEAIEKWKENKKFNEPNEEYIESFSRRNLTKKLADIFNKHI
ncbi:MAG: glycosyltransferase family 4 protein [Bacteroidales bacterium]|nr:glycosyltransferase family 4 protein [Bacteroidales bacterium]